MAGCQVLLFAVNLKRKSSCLTEYKATMEQIKTKPDLIETGDLFRSTNDRVAKSAEAQVRLYRHDINLQDYFHALDFNMLYGQRSDSRRNSSINPIAVWGFQAADRARRIAKPRKIKTDILFCPTPYHGRKTEVRFLIRTLLGLAETGAEIVCLLPDQVPFRTELDTKLNDAGHSKQVRFLDPRASSSYLEGRMRTIAAKLRARAAFETTVQILEPYGLRPTISALPDFEKTAHYIEDWERLAPSIDFGAVVARCHWYDLCSSVCRTGLERDKPVITFQQGVVDCTLDVPIVASKFVSFGASSASVLSELNGRFFDAIGSPRPAVDFVPAGSLFDLLPSLPDQFSLQTLLLIDTHSVPGDPWGTKSEVAALLDLAERLLKSEVPLRRIVIRPHPHWSDHNLDACLKLVREHSDKCELSHPAWSLEEDLRRSSVVIGIASGVLTVASASGLPTIFLRVENGFSIRDLDCFSRGQTLLPDEAFREVSRLLTDRESYAEARVTAKRNAGEYYSGCANAELDGAFFTRLLSNGEEKRAHAPKDQSR
jgi:hypothetical protein